MWLCLKFTCEAIKEKTNAFTVGGANNVAVSEERRITIGKGYSVEIIERCVCEIEEEERK